MTDMGKQVRELLPEYPHLWSRVIACLEKAVEAERAKARVVLPSDEDVIRYKKAFRLSEGTWPSVEYLARYMRSQAKIGWGEK